MKLSVIGLGKLGAPLAAVLAARGNEVVGVDLSPSTVDAINMGRAPVVEPGLPEMLAQCDGRLRATSDLAAAVVETEVTFVLVPTPSGPDGTFSLDLILPAVEAVGRALRGTSQPHLVVITSTVMPGATAGPITEALERESGLEVGRTVGLCYSPEFIALGSVVRDLLNPDMILVGESDPASGDTLARLLSSVVLSDARVQRMNLVNAELAKISVNTYVTTKISYANMLAEMCEAIPGSDVDVVTGALGLDTRIGSKYLKGATPYGGPCFPRDNVAFARLATLVGTRADIAEATDAVNRRQVARAHGRVVAALPAGGRVAVLGLAYKPDTPVIDESFGVALAASLSADGIAVDVHDPAALTTARPVLGESVGYHADVTDCLVKADVVVICTAWPEYAELGPRQLAAACLVIDAWRVLPGQMAGELPVVHLGTGPEVPPDGAG